MSDAGPVTEILFFPTTTDFVHGDGWRDTRITLRDVSGVLRQSWGTQVNDLLQGVLLVSACFFFMSCLSVHGQRRLGLHVFSNRISPHFFLPRVRRPVHDVCNMGNMGNVDMGMEGFGIGIGMGEGGLEMGLGFDGSGFDEAAIDEWIRQAERAQAQAQGQTQVEGQGMRGENDMQMQTPVQVYAPPISPPPGWSFRQQQTVSSSSSPSPDPSASTYIPPLIPPLPSSSSTQSISSPTLVSSTSAPAVLIPSFRVVPPTPNLGTLNTSLPPITTTTTTTHVNSANTSISPSPTTSAAHSPPDSTSPPSTSSLSRASSSSSHSSRASNSNGGRRVRAILPMPMPSISGVSPVLLGSDSSQKGH